MFDIINKKDSDKAGIFFYLPITGRILQREKEQRKKGEDFSSPGRF